MARRAGHRAAMGRGAGRYDLDRIRDRPLGGGVRRPGLRGDLDPTSRRPHDLRSRRARLADRRRRRRRSARELQPRPHGAGHVRDVRRRMDDRARAGSPGARHDDRDRDRALTRSTVHAASIDRQKPPSPRGRPAEDLALMSWLRSPTVRSPTVRSLNGKDVRYSLQGPSRLLSASRLGSVAGPVLATYLIHQQGHGSRRYAARRYS